MKISYVICFTVLNLWTFTRGELFTAISDVEPLLETHRKIIDDLDDYINKEERRLSILKRHLFKYKNEHEKAMDDIPNYLGNPINAFTLIKRLTTDLDIIEKDIVAGTAYIKNITILNNHSEVKYPTLEDLVGAAQALTRLQETYHLDVTDLSEGRLNGVIYRDSPTISKDDWIAVSTSMSSSDCYELGKALYNERDYTNALAWMMEALRKYSENDVERTFTEVDILEYIGFSHYLLDDVKTALLWTKKLLELDPNHTRALGNLPHYNKAMDEIEAKRKQRLRGDTGEVDIDEYIVDDDITQKKPVELTTYEKERKAYEALCRGEMEISKEISKKLFCRYLTENHPFLKLAPVKMEYMYLNPDIMVFHEVLSDLEIEHIKEMAKPRFRRATVHDPKTGELVPANYRISKSGWLKDEESPMIARVSRRVADFTGLNMMSAEELQVVNYGIGGHYEPHFDFARKQEQAFEKFNGNRIATVLFYMSDVAQGGATVFTELGLSVFPVKGAAVFWLNLHPSGEGDLATRHAACPVLRGSKWVCNKWIHQGGQELIMPCDLEYQSEGMTRTPLRPVSKTFR
ncbi:prolyl 4-hydroxylase subunit alpha-1 isoform X1 [Pararge aegeria]|nr:prolyl 4-hydroxylase subunit alpha-1 isoform X1 [Pararge aegeria]XP_039751148.1 prolyl 4-hydroxylase subunit alpha-1 isoform X1 [Pararge aegeria]XP_039751149.1 prolyl 4-hydroxylase subunit alpha-1 isoform X1 [Pararge aegeria]